VIVSDAETILAFMRPAYRLRNAEIHGDDPTEQSLTLLDSSVTGSLAAVAEDIERVMRRAIHLVLREPRSPLLMPRALVRR
jgi:hypothetical protein